MSYILYGGLFDPPHLGHLEIAMAAYGLIKPEILIWIPARCPPHRRTNGLPADKRVEILKLWLKNMPQFTVSDIELQESHSGYSIETVEIYRQKYPDEKSYLLVGTDEAEGFKCWKEWQNILQMTTLIVGRRKEKESIPVEIKNNAVFLDNKIFDVSSTQIRKSIHENNLLEGSLDTKVSAYIAGQDLYT